VIALEGQLVSMPALALGIVIAIDSSPVCYAVTVLHHTTLERSTVTA
jgi:hypothetical protein